MQTNKYTSHSDLRFVQKVLKRFKKGEIFLVGGAVRDGMLGKESKDFDFVVRGVPAKELQKFLKTLGKVNLVGKSFGVFKFLPKKIHDPNLEPIDIALPRKEKSKGMKGGYKDFEIQSDPDLPIEDDLSRRDFTVNAMAMPIRINQLNRHKSADALDPFDGLDDLKKKIIRAVGKPEERFKEDYSRILRAIRLACQLRFTIEKNTWHALTKLGSHLNDKTNGEFIVPRETIGKEIVKAFFYNPARAFELFDEAGIFKLLIPELLAMKKCPQPEAFHTEGDVWNHTNMALETLGSKKLKKEFNDDLTVDANLIFATLFHDIGKPPTLKTPEKHGTDRIRFDGHDRVGAQIARDICSRLRLDQFPKHSLLHVNPEHVGWMIDYHLLTVTSKINEMRPATIEKYFFSERFPGTNLLKLMFADGSASLPPSGKPDLTAFYALRKRIKQLKSLSVKKQTLPPPLLSGDEIMKLLKIPSGPEIGENLKLLRELQLEEKIKTKAQARKFLSKI